MTRIIGALLLGALTLSACAGGSGGDRNTLATGERLESIAETSEGQIGPVTPEGPRAAPEGTNPLPPVDVIDVRTGSSVNLGTLLPASKPVLVWFWAPHCPYYRREAPGVNEFATAHKDRLTVVGLGTQDDLDYAKSFVDEFRLPDIQMLWDPSFESWRSLGVRGQPAALLITEPGLVRAIRRG